MTTVYVSFDKELFFENEEKAFAYWEENVWDSDFEEWLNFRYNASDIYDMIQLEQTDSLVGIFEEDKQSEFQGWIESYFLAFDIN